MANAIGAKIESLEQRVKLLKAKQQRVEARKRGQLVRRERREETRRKILVGAIVLARVEGGQLSEADLKSWLDPTLTREDDRVLFGLPPCTTATDRE